MIRFTWSRQKPDRWYRGEAMGSNLKADGVVVVHVRSARGGGFYWYTLTAAVPHRNTAEEPSPDLGMAKAQCEKYMREHMNGGAS